MLPPVWSKAKLVPLLPLRSVSWVRPASRVSAVRFCTRRLCDRLMIIAPIAILLTAGRSDRSVKHHASEALNAQIWFAIVWNVLIGSTLIFSVATNHRSPPNWMLLIVPLAFLLFATVAGLAIRGTVQASRGVWWRYPLPFRFVRGAANH